MTKKMIEDVRRYFAEEVLGLEKKEVPYMFQGDMKPHQFVEAWCDESGSRYEVPTFRPDKNLEQAFDVLDNYLGAMDYKEGLHYPTQYWCNIFNGNGDGGFYESDTRIKAILGCILKAEDKTELLEVLEGK